MSQSTSTVTIIEQTNQVELTVNNNTVTLNTPANNVVAVAQVNLLFPSSNEQSFNNQTQFDNAVCQNGSMSLITLSRIPISNSNVMVFFNGLLLAYQIDYTIVNNNSVIATANLNQQTGGSGNDGLGFENTDRVNAFYSYSAS